MLFNRLPYRMFEAEDDSSFGDDDSFFDDVELDLGETEDTPESEEETTDEQPDEQPEEEVQTEQPETSPFLKVKYNKEEMELDEEKARELAQKGLNYDKVQERLQQLETDPRLTFVQDLAQANGMDVDQFINSFKEQQFQSQLDELVQNNIPEEYAREMLENRKFREQFESDKKAREAQEQKEKDDMEFLQYFKDINGRDYSEDDVIPNEVWESVEKGTPLKYAYMQHKTIELQNQVKTLKQNEKNSVQAPVKGTTDHGSSNNVKKDPFEEGFDSEY